MESKGDGNCVVQPLNPGWGGGMHVGFQTFTNSRDDASRFLKIHTIATTFT